VATGRSLMVDEFYLGGPRSATGARAITSCRSKGSFGWP